MKGIMLFAASLAILALFVFGYLEMKKSDVRKYNVGDYEINLVNIPISISSTRNIEGGYGLFSAEIMVYIYSNRLYVNFTDYGVVSNNASVFISDTGVTVDGIERDGTVLSYEKALEIAPKKKSRAMVGGHKVTAVPGWSIHGVRTYWFSSKEKLRAGSYRMVVHDHHLLINGTDFGYLDVGEELLLRWDKVYAVKEGQRRLLGKVKSVP